MQFANSSHAFACLIALLFASGSSSVRALGNAKTLPTQSEGTGSKQQTSLDTTDAENQVHKITSSPGSAENSDEGKWNQFVFK